MTLPYYPFYWGDYSAKTFNLTLGQHGAYMLLLRHIYVEQTRIPDEKRYEICRAISEIDKRNVDEVLAIYFLKKDGKWRNDRAFEVISKQHELHEANVNKGKKGGRPPKLELKLDLSQNKVEPKQPEPEPEPEPIDRKKEPKKVLSKEKRGTRLPDDFEPDATCEAVANEMRLTMPQSQMEFEKFKDYWKGKAGAVGIKLDWQATFRNWLRNSKTQGAKNGNYQTNHKRNSIAENIEIANAAIDAALEREAQREASFSAEYSYDDIKPISRLQQIDS